MIRPRTRIRPLLFCAALVGVFASRSGAKPQTTPPTPPSPPRRVTDTIFAGIEKFEAHARSVTHVDSDHDHDRGPDGSVNDVHRLSAVYVYSYDQPGLYNPADVDVYRQKLHTAEWTCHDCAGRLKLGESVEACTRPAGAASVETAVIDMRPERLTFVHTIGKQSEASGNLQCHAN